MSLTLKRFFAHARTKTLFEMRLFFKQKEHDLLMVNQWGSDTAQRLYNFAIQGKGLRGGLVFLGARLAGGGSSRHVAKLAAAIELLHSALLIHDDIMDEDELRRGAPSIFVQYQKIAHTLSQNQAKRFGESLGICAGDLGFFLAQELAAESEAGLSVWQRVAKELAGVCVAQMQDVSFGFNQENSTEEKILQLYRYKTARYTFSLPLMTGGLVGGAAPALLKKFELLGEYLGIIFQIKDDELGLFGNQLSIGKSVGSDVREGKKTLHFLKLLNWASPRERRRLGVIFGNRSLSISDIRYVRSLIQRYKILPQIDIILAQFADRAQRIIARLSVADAPRRILQQLLQYNLKREV